MKKSFVGKCLFAAAMLCMLFAALAFGACATTEECGHPNATSTTTATCTEAGETTFTCPDCGATWTDEAAALGHAWGEWTDNGDGTHTHTCSRDASHTEKQACSFGEGVVTTPATCEAAGERTYTCADCGATKTEAIAQLSHAYRQTKEVAPTCTEAGYTEYTCDNCGDTKEEAGETALGHEYEGLACEGKHCTRDGCTEEIPAQPHRYERSGTKDATCTESGKIVYTCTICGNASYELDDTDAPALGHTFGEDSVWENAGEETLVDGETCVYRVEKKNTCTRCGKEVVEPQTYEKHTYVTVISKKSTCTEEGEKVQKCSACGDILEGSGEAYLDADAHTWDEGREEGSYIVFTCTHNEEHTKRTIVGNEDGSASVTEDTLTGADEIDLGGAVISVPEGALGDVGGQNMTLRAEATKGSEIKDENIPEDTLDKIGEGLVYDLTLTGENDENLGASFSGNITVKLPYTLQPGEDVSAIVVWYVNGVELEEFRAVFTATGETDENGAIEGYVTFETTHFSYYTVGRYTAEEMCEKYDHNIIVRQKTATCTESGYYIEMCSRCGQIVREETYPMTGHRYSVTDSEAATCTEGGSTVYSCANCGSTYSLPIPPRGHVWEAVNTQKATCGASGFIEYECSGCDESYTETLPQLAHRYTVQVTAPTCTGQGYTTHTCSMCGDSYTDGYVEPLGHSWNISAPTCGEGQVCTVCGAEGLPATGEHTYGENGVCTVCGSGCEHSFAAAGTTPPTCTERGYTKYVCEKCGKEEIRDYVPAAGHAFTEDYAVCDVCGQPNPALETMYLQMLESLGNGKYAFTLEDVVIDVQEENISTGTVGYSNHIVVHFDYIYLQREEEGVWLIAAEGRFLQESGGREDAISFSAVGDGAWLYLNYDTTDTSWTGYDAYARLSYAETLRYVFGGFEADSLEDYPVFSMLEKLSDYIGQFTNNNGGVANEMLGKVFAHFFDGKQTESGYVFAIDTAALAKLNDDLYTLSVPAFIDEYFGEGSFDKLESFAEEKLFDQTVSDAVIDILGYADDYGYTAEQVYAMVDELVALATGDASFSIEAFLQTEESTTKTFAELIAGDEAAFREQYDMILGLLKAETLDDYVQGGSGASVKNTVYNLLFLMTNGYNVAESADILHDIVGDVFGQGFGMTAVTDEYGNVESASLTLDEVSVDVESGSYAEHVGISGGLSVEIGADIDIANDADYERFMASIRGKYDAFMQAVIDKCNGSEGKAFSVGGYTFMLQADGSVVVRSENHFNEFENPLKEGYYMGRRVQMVEFGAVTEVRIFDLDERRLFQWSADCGDYGRYSFDCVQESNYTRSYGIRYYDAETGELVYETVNERNTESRSYFGTMTVYTDLQGNFTERSAHNYIVDESEENTTEEDVACGESYAMHYVCEHCGDKYVTEGKKYHGELVETAELKDGASNCEEGVIITRKCADCGEIVETYEDMWHHAVDNVTEVSTPHGTLRIVYSACACGQEAYVNTDGCAFDGEPTDTKYYGNDEFGLDHCLEIYTCAVSEPEECGFVMAVDVYYEYIDETSCDVRRVREYNFYSTAADVGVKDPVAGPFVVRDGSWGEMHNYETQAEFFGEENCESGVLYTDICSHCGDVARGSAYTTYSHDLRMAEEMVIVTPGGDKTLVLYSCACGARSDLDYGMGGCELILTGKGEEDAEGHVIEEYACPDEDGFTMKIERYTEEAEDECIARSYAVYTFYQGGEPLCEEIVIVDTWSTHSYAESEPEEVEENGIVRRTVRSVCEICGELNYETITETYAETGLLYRHTERNYQNGTVISEFVTIYEYDAEGNLIREERTTSAADGASSEVNEYAYDADGMQRTVFNEFTAKNAEGEITEYRREEYDRETFELLYREQKTAEENGDYWWTADMVDRDGNTLTSVTERVEDGWFYSETNISEYGTGTQLSNKTIERGDNHYYENYTEFWADGTTAHSEDMRLEADGWLYKNVNDNDEYGRTVKDASQVWGDCRLDAETNEILLGELIEDTVRSYTYESCTSRYTDYFDNMTGDSYEGEYEQGDFHVYAYSEDKTEATCTQFGYSCRECSICGEFSDIYVNEKPFGHNYQDDDGDGIFVCTWCGLQNFTGSDGPITLEDLTGNAIYGVDGSYVVGYWNMYDYDFDIRLQFVAEGEAEGVAADGYIGIKTTESYENTGLCYISADEVRAAASELGVDPAACDLRIDFIPVGAGQDFPCSITLTELAA